jgi:hypothetical protein
MPATSIRDLVVHGNDVVVGTHGRSFWVLDDISPLRQISGLLGPADLELFVPSAAVRVRRSVATDTPLPPDEPLAPNPPDGAVIDFRLARAATGPVTLEILDSDGKLVRKYASDDKPEAVNPVSLQIDPRWIRPARILPATAGTHRFVWDLHYAPLDGPRSYPISAVWNDTPSGPLGPMVKPGIYTVKLTANGKSVTQKLTVTMDPRVATPAEGLEQQHALSMQCYNGATAARHATDQIRSLRRQLADVRAKPGAPGEAIAAVETKLTTLEGTGFGGGRGGGGRGGPPRDANPTFGRAAGELGRMLAVLQAADATPTTQTATAVAAAKKDLDGLLARWADLRDKDLTELNGKLKAAGLPAVDPGGSK